MAAGFRSAARRIAAALCWASAAYVLLRVAFYYLHVADTRRHHVEAASIIFVAALLARVLMVERAASADTGQTPVERQVSPVRAALAFVAAALALYWPVLSTGLFADDFVLIEAARAGRFTVWSELFRPSLFVVWRAILGVIPQPAVGLHVVNVVLHGTNAFLVSRLAEAVGLRRAAALCAGGLFLSYPAAVEAVAWPSGIQDVLMTTCVLVILIVASADRTWLWRLSWAGVGLLAALLTKETAIAAPFLVLMLGLIREIRKAAWLTAAVCGLVVAVFIAIRFTLLPLPANYSPAPSRYAAKELLVRPFATLIVPFREDETLQHPALGIVSASSVVLMLAFAGAASGWRDRHTARALAAACMVLGGVAPVLAYFYIDPNLLGSRYIYLALVGWVILLATSAGSRRPHAKRAIAPLVCLIAFWIPATRSHLALWRNAAMTREHMLAAAAAVSDRRCSGWIVSGVPASVDGVPLFVNGFPEAARPALGEPIHMAPARAADGQCQLTWTGEEFKRAE